MYGFGLWSLERDGAGRYLVWSVLGSGIRFVFPLGFGFLSARAGVYWALTTAAWVCLRVWFALVCTGLVLLVLGWYCFGLFLFCFYRTALDGTGLSIVRTGCTLPWIELHWYRIYRAGR